MYLRLWHLSSYKHTFDSYVILMLLLYVAVARVVLFVAALLCLTKPCPISAKKRNRYDTNNNTNSNITEQNRKKADKQKMVRI